MAIMRSIIIGAVLAGCVAGPALAQKSKGSENALKIEEDQRRKDDAAIDRQYRATLERTRKNTPVQTNVNDPWTNMRSADDSKAKR